VQGTVCLKLIPQQRGKTAAIKSASLKKTRHVLKEATIHATVYTS
jgi:hypothetical protein